MLSMRKNEMKGKLALEQIIIMLGQIIINFTQTSLASANSDAYYNGRRWLLPESVPAPVKVPGRDVITSQGARNRLILIRCCRLRCLAYRREKF